MKKVFFGILIGLISLPAMAVTVSGTVLDHDGEPLDFATVHAPGTTKGFTIVNDDGTFSESIDVDANTELEVSFAGCTPQKFKASELNNKKIELNCQNLLDTTVVVTEFKSRNCNSNELDAANATAGKTALKDGESGIFCNPTACKCGYDLDKSDSAKHKCVKWEDGKKCTKNTTPKLPNNAKSANMVCENDVAVCKIESCDGVEFELKENKCVKTTGDECKSDDANAKTAKLEKRGQKMVCVIKKCNDGYVPADDGLSCVLSEGDCTDEQLSALDENATKGELKKQKCTITECKPGLTPENNKCVEISGACGTDDLPENATFGQIKFDSASQKKVCLVSGCVGGYKPSDDKLSCVVDEDEQSKIDDAREKYEAAKANEQSLGNRLLGAATMGSMGIGGMMVASSLAEQNADADAELDMTAYLATFKCDYGAGLNIRGGEVNVELPGAAELIPLYSEYVMLANDLKARKNQLGLKAGIESEKILDSATTGLYDDVGVGITSGAYASLARALQDPDGADAKMWAEQKEKSAQNLKTGAITAGVGAVVGIAGNIISTSVYKNKIKKLESLDKLKDDVEALPEQKPESPCPKGASGTPGMCNCETLGEYNSNTNSCDPCVGVGRTAKNGKCGCYDTKKTQWDESKNQCVEPVQSCTPECNPTPGSHLVIDKETCKCSCLNGFILSDDGKSCRCDATTKEIKEGKCVDKQITDNTLINGLANGVLNGGLAINSNLIQPQKIVLSGEALFKLESYDLTERAQAAIVDFAKNLKEKDNAAECTFEVLGYTDRSGSNDVNQKLSEKRAKAIKNALVEQLKKQHIEYAVTAKGMGEEYCFCEKDHLTGACSGLEEYDMPEDDTYYKPCRKVEIEASCSKAEENSEK